MSDTEGKKRKPKKTKTFVVLKDGVQCCYGHRNCFALKLGVLVPCGDRERPQIFGGEASAGKAIDRTIAVRERMKNSLLDDWPKFDDLMKAGNFKIEFVQPTG